MPGTGPTITTFVAYAFGEEDLEDAGALRPRRDRGRGRPEASTHSSVQVDFIPTMSLGIPGDAVMALMLGALMIQGIEPGPQLITEHAGPFLGPDRELLGRQPAAGASSTCR